MLSPYLIIILMLYYNIMECTHNIIQPYVTDINTDSSTKKLDYLVRMQASWRKRLRILSGDVGPHPFCFRAYSFLKKSDLAIRGIWLYSSQRYLTYIWRQSSRNRGNWLSSPTIWGIRLSFPPSVKGIRLFSPTNQGIPLSFPLSLKGIWLSSLLA